MTEIVFPNDANPLGNAMGGRVMHWIDICAALAAGRTLALANDEVAAQSDDESALTRKLWPYLLLAALAIIMLEWWVYNRKVAI